MTRYACYELLSFCQLLSCINCRRRISSYKAVERLFLQRSGKHDLSKLALSFCVRIRDGSGIENLETLATAKDLVNNFRFYLIIFKHNVEEPYFIAQSNLELLFA